MRALSFTFSGRGSREFPSGGEGAPQLFVVRLNVRLVDPVPVLWANVEIVDAPHPAEGAQEMSERPRIAVAKAVGILREPSRPAGFTERGQLR